MPVIDLRGGVVVHARRGRRSAYRPLRSRLCRGADPAAVAEALVSLHPAPAIYVADLDRIEGRGDNRAAIARLRAAVPGVELWVDPGARSAAECADWLASEPGGLVVGTESAREDDLLARLRAGPGDARVILSLDHRGGRLLGPDGILADAARWPSRVIAMELERVGSGTGPGLGLLEGVRARAAGRAVLIGGGVRDAADLAALAAAGATGALVATALHDGGLGAADLARVARRPRPRGGAAGS